MDLIQQEEALLDSVTSTEDTITHIDHVSPSINPQNSLDASEILVNDASSTSSSPKLQLTAVEPEIIPSELHQSQQIVDTPLYNSLVDGLEDVKAHPHHETKSSPENSNSTSTLFDRIIPPGTFGLPFLTGLIIESIGMIAFYLWSSWDLNRRRLDQKQENEALNAELRSKILELSEQIQTEKEMIYQLQREVDVEGQYKLI